MTYKRPSKSRLDNLVQKMHRQQTEINKLTKLISSFDDVFWKEFSQRLIAWRKRIESSRNAGYMQMTESALKVDMAKENLLDDILLMPDKIEETLEGMQKELIETRKNVTKQKKRLQLV